MSASPRVAGTTRFEYNSLTADTLRQCTGTVGHWRSICGSWSTYGASLDLNDSGCVINHWAVLLVCFIQMFKHKAHGHKGSAQYAYLCATENVLDLANRFSRRVLV